MQVYALRRAATIAGFTLALVEDDEIVATSTDVPGLSVTYPPGTTFPSGTTMAQTANGGVTLLEIDGPVMPSGQTKSISYDTTPSYRESAVYQASYARTFQADGWLVTACVYDSGATVDIGTVHPYTCADEGGLDIYVRGGFYRTHEASGAGTRDVNCWYLDSSSSTGPSSTRYNERSVDPFTLTLRNVTAAATREERNAVDGLGEAFTWYPVTQLTITVGELSHTSIALFDDTDGDGVPDADERLAYGTDPAAADTHGDGVSDGDEVAAGMAPTDATSTPETDGDHDFLDLSIEARLGTDPNDADTDGGGRPHRLVGGDLSAGRRRRGRGGPRPLPSVRAAAPRRRARSRGDDSVGVGRDPAHRRADAGGRWRDPAGRERP